MRPKVVLTWNLDGIPHEKDFYERVGVDFVKTHCLTEDELIAAGKDADVIIGIAAFQPLTRRVMENMPRCRFIMSIGIGIDKLDVDAATDLGVITANTAGFCTEELSDHAMALLLALNRKLFQLHRAVKEGKWGGPSFSPEIVQGIWPNTFRMRGQTLGLLGLGRSGRSLIPKAQGFGLRVIAYDPFVPAKVARELNVEPVDLDQLLKESDYISIHAPSIPETHHMLGLEQFKKMKRTAYLANTARGSIIDEKALITALSEGYIAGAGLDVLETEPPNLNNPLLKMDNVIVTAHSAHNSVSARADAHRIPSEEALRVLRGEWPLSMLNPAVKDKFIKRWGKAALLK